MHINFVIYTVLYILSIEEFVQNNWLKVPVTVCWNKSFCTKSVPHDMCSAKHNFSSCTQFVYIIVWIKRFTWWYNLKQFIKYCIFSYVHVYSPDHWAIDVASCGVGDYEVVAHRERTRSHRQHVFRLRPSQSKNNKDIISLITSVISKPPWCRNSK